MEKAPGSIFSDLGNSKSLACVHSPVKAGNHPFCLIPTCMEQRIKNKQNRLLALMQKAPQAIKKVANV
jgi:hypothetical protein